MEGFSKSLIRAAIIDLVISAVGYLGTYILLGIEILGDVYVSPGLVRLFFACTAAGGFALLIVLWAERMIANRRQLRADEKRRQERERRAAEEARNADMERALGAINSYMNSRMSGGEDLVANMVYLQESFGRLGIDLELPTVEQLQRHGETDLKTTMYLLRKELQDRDMDKVKLTVGTLARIYRPVDKADPGFEAPPDMTSETRR